MPEYYYYIIINGFNSESLKKNELPQIFKIRKDLGIIHELINEEEGEGPFDSIIDFKKNSIILSKIKLGKHRERVLANKNIKEIKDFIRRPSEEAYELTFIKAFHHVNVGKIHKKEVKGVHFFNPDTIKILEVLDKDERTGIYSARISKYNHSNNQWIEKKEPTNFFPDNWDLEKLFSELNYVYNNRVYLEGNVYLSKTTDNIKVKLIIKESEIITIYPLLE
ncbi:EndoU domain-containing protein [Chryseobacterium arthrosphaerae]|uniref:EndoU domain-containing protein n=1 Tax=Chryseobacterium arthrosphaerae TaxID=651561 RepID=UPI001E4A772C|nr:EndoU domain-containing protein [Chryseobacterium arthrosphaerae]UEQ75247.1 EndoU domain-containing protein [Chryseobacterium arthrosphaerae]